MQKNEKYMIMSDKAILTTFLGSKPVRKVATLTPTFAPTFASCRVRGVREYTKKLQK